MTGFKINRFNHEGKGGCEQSQRLFMGIPND
jgi:hypothetical protein